MTKNSVIEGRARQLPPEYQQKVLDYIHLSQFSDSGPLSVILT